MFSLYEILRTAQGGRAIENLASQFNLAPERADAAVKAVVPELSERMFKSLSEPGALASLMAALGTGRHLAAFEGPAGAQAGARAGSSALSEILGSPSVLETIAERASAATGVPKQVLSHMLPVIASIIFGGLTKSLENQGFGGLLGQVSQAFGEGSLGSALGQILGGGAAPASTEPQPAREPVERPEAGGLAGLLDIALGFLKRFAGARSGPAEGQMTPPETPSLDAGTLEAGLEALKKMLQPGTSPPGPAEVSPAGVTASPADAPQAEGPAAPVNEAQKSPPGGAPIDIGDELDRIAGKDGG